MTEAVFPCIWLSSLPRYLSLFGVFKMILNNKSEKNDGGKCLAWLACYYLRSCHVMASFLQDEIKRRVLKKLRLKAVEISLNVLDKKIVIF